MSQQTAVFKLNRHFKSMCKNKVNGKGKLFNQRCVSYTTRDAYFKAISSL